MLRIVTGPFRTDLEPALVEDIRQLKAADPFTPLAIVVPSALLAARLRDLLVVESGLSLLNVHFLTFHQLALRLDEERRTAQIAADTGPRVEVVRDLFFEHLLGRIARAHLSGLEAFRPSSLAPGAWAALWATVRDLKDGSVDPAVVLRAVEEDLFEAEETPKLRALFMLYAAMLEASRALGVGSADDLAASLIPWVPRSRFLARLTRVCYYGFYDLTQVQLSLFEAVVKSIPATLYFPLANDPAFTFARRFFERYLQSLPLSSEPGLRTPSSSAAQPAERDVCVISTVGPEDELTTVCKEILTLVESQTYRFEEIGVVGRTLEPYQAQLGRLFDAHRIPFTTTATLPVLEEPVAKVVLQLAGLRLSGFYRAPLLDVLTSPFYRADRRRAGRVEPRPDLWPIAVRTMGITRGEAEWRRLATAGGLDAWVGEADESDDMRAGRVGIPAAQLRLLWHLVSQLIRDCRALPEQGRIAELTEAFLALASKHLEIPALDESPKEVEESDRLASAGAAIRAALDQVCQLDRLEGSIGWEDWTRLFTRALEQAAIPVESSTHAGVRVLDAMAARGLPFRALFLLGLNEKVFPRFVREDAFLRDRCRRVLDATLGYKIDEKLAGYDEEQLLFVLLRQAAGRRLYLLYQRADADGRPLAASAYLAECLRAEPEETRYRELRVPRRFSDRMALPLFAPSLLTREELALRLVLRGRDPSPLLDAAGRGAALFRHGWDALRQIDGESHRLGPYDGLTGPLDRFWEQLTARGLAPTPLEHYARCPFKYFAANMLRLKPIRNEIAAELPAPVLGELCHAVLNRCYRRLIEVGWLKRELPPASIHEQVKEAVESVFAAYAVEHGTGYALIWQLAQETVARLVTAMIEADQRDFHESGFRPAGFEVEAEGRLEGLESSALEPLKISGRLDRIDRREAPPGLRIVDYKYRQSREMQSQDRDLLTAAVRGFRLQPPLYALMRPGKAADEGGTPSAPQPEQVEFLFLAPLWKPPVDRSRFDASAWRTSAGRPLRQTLRTLLEGMRSGQYFILPGEYCDRCEFSTACRRFHGPTWWRAYIAGQAKPLRLLRTQKVPRE